MEWALGEWAMEIGTARERLPDTELIHFSFSKFV